MKARQGSVFDTLRRVQAFLDANDAALGQPPISQTAARKELDALVTQMATNADSQAAGKVNAKSETANQRNLRLALRLDHMSPIAHIAKAKLKDVPQFEALVMPPSDMPAAKLVPYANAMAQAAQQYAQVFIDNALPTDFVAQLLAASAAVRASIDSRATSITQKAQSAAALKDDETKARTAIRMLDGVVKPRVAKDASLAAGWKSVKRISAKPGLAVGATKAAAAADAATQSAATTSAATTSAAPSTSTTTPAPTAPSTSTTTH